MNQIINDLNLRNELITKVEVLDKVKVVKLMPNHLFVGTEDAANYFEVNVEAIKSIIKRNRDELISDGLFVFKNHELKNLKNENLQKEDGTLYVGKKCKAYTAIPKRALLRIAMLLTKSTVAAQIRDYLLNLENIATNDQKNIALCENNLPDNNQLAEATIRIEEMKKAERIILEHNLIKCEMLGIDKDEASLLVLQSMVECKNVDNILLDKLKNKIAIKKRIQRGRIRERINYIANESYNGKHEDVYHELSERMKYEIGINMKAIRNNAKRNLSKDIPSYLDLIDKYDAYGIAEKVLADM